MYLLRCTYVNAWAKFYFPKINFSFCSFIAEYSNPNCKIANRDDNTTNSTARGVYENEEYLSGSTST